jgi:hypothetical protein
MFVDTNLVTWRDMLESSGVRFIWSGWTVEFLPLREQERY